MTNASQSSARIDCIKEQDHKANTPPLPLLHGAASCCILVSVYWSDIKEEQKKKSRFKVTGNIWALPATVPTIIINQSFFKPMIT